MTKMLDISSNNHAASWSVAQFEACREAGFEFAYVKATQGNYYVNPYCQEDVAGLIAVGVKVGLYHFFDKTIAPEIQGAFFTNMLRQVAGISLVPALDYEQSNTPKASEIAAFGRASVEPNVTYTDRWLAHALGPPPNWPIWLGWPSWTPQEDLTPYGRVVAVQTGTVTIPGITRAIDCSTVFTDGAFLAHTYPGYPHLPTSPNLLPLAQVVRLPNGLVVERVGDGVVHYINQHSTPTKYAQAIPWNG